MARKIIPEAYSRSRLLEFINKYKDAADGAVNFSVYLSSKQTIPYNTETALEFDFHQFDQVGGGYDTTTHKFTAPVDGKYYLHCNFTWMNVASNFGGYHAGFKIDPGLQTMGTPGASSPTAFDVVMRSYDTTNSPVVNNAEITDSMSIFVYLNKGETVEPFVAFTNAAGSGSEEIVGSGAGSTRWLTSFHGYRV